MGILLFFGGVDSWLCVVWLIRLVMMLVVVFVEIEIE